MEEQKKRGKNFTLALKLGETHLKFTINTRDDREELYRKIVEIYPECENRQEYILEKLRRDLEDKIGSGTVKECVREMIEEFLGRNFGGKGENEDSKGKEKEVVEKENEGEEKKVEEKKE